MMSSCRFDSCSETDLGREALQMVMVTFKKKSCKSLQLDSPRPVRVATNPRVEEKKIKSLFHVEIAILFFSF